jgi:hypothetical protein
MIVAFTPDYQFAILGSGKVIPNPYSGRVEDQTTGLVMTVAGLKAASPLIAAAYQRGGSRRG